jgi:hypothetical protein
VFGKTGVNEIVLPAWQADFYEFVSRGPMAFRMK